EGDFVGAPQGFAPNSTAAKDSRGNLWFVTVNGLIHLDPERWQAVTRPPILSLRSTRVDHHPLGDKRTVGPRPDTLEIRYLVVNLLDPEAVIYKYRLEGFDPDWQEVGHRTEAIYTRLPAGTYTFQVMASNGDGQWTLPVSSEPFRVLPSFYQTV